MRNQAKQPKRLTAEAVHAITSALRDFSYKNLTDNRVRGLSDGLLDGSISYPWGTLNKLAVHVGSDIAMDLFATTAERWFVSLVVRTGSKEMNTMLASSTLRRGMQLHMYWVLEVRATGEQIIPRS